MRRLYAKTMQFYIRDLSTCGFWYPRGFRKQSPTDTKGPLCYKTFPSCRSPERASESPDDTLRTAAAANTHLFHCITAPCPLQRLLPSASTHFLAAYFVSPLEYRPREGRGPDSCSPWSLAECVTHGDIQKQGSLMNELYQRSCSLPSLNIKVTGSGCF